MLVGPGLVLFGMFLFKIGQYLTGIEGGQAFTVLGVSCMAMGFVIFYGGHL